MVLKLHTSFHALYAHIRPRTRCRKISPLFVRCVSEALNLDPKTRHMRSTICAHMGLIRYTQWCASWCLPRSSACTGPPRGPPWLRESGRAPHAPAAPRRPTAPERAHARPSHAHRLSSMVTQRGRRGRRAPGCHRGTVRRAGRAGPWRGGVAHEVLEAVAVTLVRPKFELGLPFRPGARRLLRAAATNLGQAPSPSKILPPPPPPPPPRPPPPSGGWGPVCTGATFAGRRGPATDLV
jgi:hypothetical protein